MSVTEYKFTNNLFTPSIQTNLKTSFEKNNIIDGKELHFLEIGSYEGSSSVWLVDTYLSHINSTFTCIDPYVISNKVTEQTPMIFNYNSKICKYPGKITQYRNHSYEVLPVLSIQQQEYDVIYISGFCSATDVLFNICVSWILLRKGGLMVFDNYNSHSTNEPRLAIDSFLKLLKKNDYENCHEEYQKIIKKL